VSNSDECHSDECHSDECHSDECHSYRFLHEGSEVKGIKKGKKITHPYMDERVLVYLSVCVSVQLKKLNNN
jgi:hypothetical protein